MIIPLREDIDWGPFYSKRVEINLICKLSWVLGMHLGEDIDWVPLHYINHKLFHFHLGKEGGFSYISKSSITVMGFGLVYGNTSQTNAMVVVV